MRESKSSNIKGVSGCSERENLGSPRKEICTHDDAFSRVWHVILLLFQFVNKMSVTRLPVYYPSQEEKDNPKLYAENVRRLMAREGNLIMSDIGLAEKRVYHATLNGRLTVLHEKDD
ncbi:hypothetical protein Lser_V15G30147 [Lactuca serriola]